MDPSKPMVIPVNLDATIVATGATTTNCTFSNIQQAAVINNHYGPQDQWDANKLDHFVQMIRTHLCQFYQTEAKYISTLSEEDSQWSIAQTYRQLALVISTSKTRALYTIKAIDETKLPDLKDIVPWAVIVTADREAYFIEEGNWLRAGLQGHLIRILGIDFPEGMVEIRNDDLQPYAGNTEPIIAKVLERYRSTVAVAELLPTYETNRLEKRPIELADLFNVQSTAGATSSNSIPRVLVTGVAGVGKSTLLQYIAYCWSLDSSKPILEGIKPLWQAQYDCVFWLPLKLLHRDEYCLKDENAHFQLEHFISTACGLYDQVLEAKKPDFLNHFSEFLLRYQNRILLLVDSFDEVAHWVSGNSPQSRVLSALFRWQGPMILTSRPYAKGSIPSVWSGYRWIENQGFTDTDVKAFVTYYFARGQVSNAARLGEDLLQLIFKNPRVWGLAHVPLITRLLCLHWHHASPSERIEVGHIAEEMTITSLMRGFIKGFIQRSLNKEASYLNIQRLVEDPQDVDSEEIAKLRPQRQEWLGFLGQLAFAGLQAGESQILSLKLQKQVFGKATAEAIGWFKEVLSLGLLQPVGRKDKNPFKVQHTFLHLLFQEYLAATHVMRHLKKTEIQQFIVEHRYVVRYQYVLAFAAGLLGLKPKCVSQQQQFWALLRQEPRSINGLGDALIGLVCLTETQGRMAIRAYEAEVLEENQRWLQWLMNQKQAIQRRHYQGVVSQLMPVWQQLRIRDGQKLLSKWSNSLERIVAGIGEPEDVEEIKRLWWVLLSIGAKLLEWVGKDWLHKGVQQLEASQNQDLLNVLALLLGLEADWDTTLLKPVLMMGLQSKDYGIRRMSIKAIEELGMEVLWNYTALKAVILEGLKSENDDVRQMSIQAIEGLEREVLWNDEVLKVAILEGLKSEDNKVKYMSVRAIEGWLGTKILWEDEALKAAILEGLKSEDIIVKHMSFEAVVGLWTEVLWNDEVLKAAILEGLKSENYGVRQMSIQAIEGLGREVLWNDEALKAAILEGLKSDDIRVSCMSVRAIEGWLWTEVLWNDEVLKAAILEGLKSEYGYRLRWGFNDAIKAFGKGAVWKDKEIGINLFASLLVRHVSIQVIEGGLGREVLWNDEALTAAILEGLKSEDIRVSCMFARAIKGGGLWTEVLWNDEVLKATILEGLQSKHDYRLQWMFNNAIKALGKGAVWKDTAIGIKLIVSLLNFFNSIWLERILRSEEDENKPLGFQETQGVSWEKQDSVLRVCLLSALGAADDIVLQDMAWSIWLDFLYRSKKHELLELARWMDLGEDPGIGEGIGILGRALLRDRRLLYVVMMRMEADAKNGKLRGFALLEAAVASEAEIAGKPVGLVGLLKAAMASGVEIAGEPVGLVALLEAAMASGNAKLRGFALVCCDYFQDMEPYRELLLREQAQLSRDLRQWTCRAFEAAIVVLKRYSRDASARSELFLAFAQGFEIWWSQSKDKSVGEDSAEESWLEEALNILHQKAGESKFLSIDLVPVFERLLQSKVIASGEMLDAHPSRETLCVSTIQALCQKMPLFTPAISIAVLNTGYFELPDGEELPEALIYKLEIVLLSYYKSLDCFSYRGKYLAPRALGITGEYSKVKALLATMFSSQDMQIQAVAFGIGQHLPSLARCSTWFSVGLQTLQRIIVEKAGKDSDDRYPPVDTSILFQQIARHYLTGDWESQVVGWGILCLLPKHFSKEVKRDHFFMQDKRSRIRWEDVYSGIHAHLMIEIHEELVGDLIVLGALDLMVSYRVRREVYIQIFLNHVSKLQGQVTHLALKVADRLRIPLDCEQPLIQQDSQTREMLDLNQLRELYSELVQDVWGKTMLQKIEDLVARLRANPDEMSQGLSYVEAHLLLEGVFLMDSDNIAKKIQALLTNRSLRTDVWDLWLEVFYNYLEPNHQKQLYAFIEDSCLMISGSLSCLLQKVKSRPELEKRHEPLVARLTSSKALELLLREYQEASHDIETVSGLTIELYRELIQWMFAQMLCSVVIDSKANSSEEEGCITIYDGADRRQIKLNKNKLVFFAQPNTNALVVPQATPDVAEPENLDNENDPPRKWPSCSIM